MSQPELALACRLDRCKYTPMLTVQERNGKAPGLKFQGVLLLRSQIEGQRCLLRLGKGQHPDRLDMAAVGEVEQIV